MRTLEDFEAMKIRTPTAVVGMYTTAFALFVNKAKFESLPPDVRKVLAETTSPRSGYSRKIGEFWDRAAVVGRKAILG